MKKIINKVLQEWPIFLILLFSLILHVLVLKELGFEYTLESDDMGYVISGIEFANTGRITMYGVLSAQIMPGMTFLIGLLSLIFGEGHFLWIVLKILWMAMGMGTILVVYKTIKLFANKYVSAIPCLFFLSINYVWMDNIILTETPYIFLFSLLVYHTLKLAQKPNWKDYTSIVLYYISAVFLRPNIGIYPIFLIIYLLLKKYDFKLLIKQCFIAGGVLLVCLIPWTYRNYKVFDNFIPLTYGVGNPLLLGTYQGYGYPLDENLNYVENVDNKLPHEIKECHINNNCENATMKRYYSLEYDKYKAMYRMREWWNSDKKSMIISYLVLKPKENIYSLFYWDEVMGISSSILKIFLRLEIVLFLVSSLVVIVKKRYLKEILFLGLLYASQVALYSYTFAFSRYAISMFFIRYIVIGLGLASLCEIVKKRRSKNENLNDNTGL